ncbi:unnamed protein product [Auanema sp. JU1783]|nr:unnamed protein product [Auanema sp. JU1783]
MDGEEDVKQSFIAQNNCNSSTNLINDKIDGNTATVSSDPTLDKNENNENNSNQCSNMDSEQAASLYPEFAGDTSSVSSSVSDFTMFIKPATYPDFTQDPFDIQPGNEHSQIPSPEERSLNSTASTPNSDGITPGSSKVPEAGKDENIPENPLQPRTSSMAESDKSIKQPVRGLKKSVSILIPAIGKIKEKFQKKSDMARDRRRSTCSEQTPLLAGCRSLPNVADDGTSAIVDYPEAPAHTRSEIGRDEFQKKRRSRRRRYNTERSERPKLLRPFIASPFMPIPTQVATEVDRRSFIGGLPKDSNKNVLTYGSSTRPAEEGLLRKKSEQDCDSEDDPSSSDSDSEISIKKPFLFDLSSKEWLTIAMLAIANLSSTVAFSCIAPFYPNEAALKGMTETQTGMVFGVFELTMFLTAPIFGKYMIAIGSKRMFVVGLLITSATAILFGFLNFIPSGTLFFWASFIIRIFEAIGDAAFITSSFAISAKCFPGRITVIVGVMETFAGLGYSVGPLIGGVLYEFGGFQVPFLFLGCLLFFIAALSYFLLEPLTDQEVNDEKGMMSMLKIPMIWIMLYSIVACAISLSYLDPTLAGHLLSFELSPTWVGLMFLLCGGVYTIAAPICGWLIDKCRCTMQLMLFGSLLNVFGMLLIGPSPFLNLEKNIYIIGFSLSLLGIAAGAQYIPTFQACLDAAKENGYEDNFHTYGLVSGLFQSAFAFGSFFGPTVGGFAVERIGFPWTCSIIAFIQVMFICTVFVFYGYRSCFRKK